MNVILSETDGWTEDLVKTPSETSREYLLRKIKGIEILEEINEEYTYEKYEEYIDENDDDSTINQINEFICDIELLCKNN